jgi:hypothetical protein
MSFNNIHNIISRKTSPVYYHRDNIDRHIIDLAWPCRETHPQKATKSLEHQTSTTYSQEATAHVGQRQKTRRKGD